MVREFKTKDQMLGFIKRFSFENVRYNRIEIGKKGKIWWVSYD